nr:hypothetical protein [Tanacetum cinerariifolium]
MDLIIPLGQKNTLVEYMILSGAENRPPILDKDLYDSWKSIIELYMQNREHEKMILESVENGLLIWPTVEENGMTKTNKYAELFVAEKIQADCDMKATSIILQGLPADIYLLVNYHRVAKDLWERVQILMRCTLLTKQERECKLYDAFDKFTHIKGESLHKYYLRFTQLINDMNIYNMKMGQFQVNTKFLNRLPPEWSKFVTDGSPQPIINLELPRIQEIKLLFKMAGSQCNKFKGDKGKVILVVVIKVILLVLGETMQVDMQGLLNATTVKVKDIWLGNALSLSDQGMQHDPGVPDGQAVHTIIPNNAAFQTEDLDTYDSDCDVSNAKAVLMANISNYGSDIISEVPHSETYLNDMENQSVHAMQDFEQSPVVDFPDNEIHKTLILEEVSRSKMSEKEKDPEAIKRKISNKPIDYVKLNKLYEDFRKRFVPQHELSADEVFYYHMLNPSTKSFDALPIKIEALKELSKVSLVNESLKKLKLHLASFDKVVKIKTTPNARTEAQLQDKDTKLKKITKSMREKSKEKNVNYDYCEIETKNVKLDNSVTKFLLENERLCKEINHVKHVFKVQFHSIKKTRVCTKEQSDSLIDKLNLKSAKNEDLKAQIQDKVFVITSLKNDLRKIKGKESVAIVVQKPSANTMVPGMFKLDLDPLAPKLLQNRESHIDYLKYTQEQADILQGIVEQAKAKQPLDNALDFALETQKPELKVYSRKPKNVKNVGSNKKAKIVESKNANYLEPNHTWGSNATDIPLSSSLVMTGGFVLLFTSANSMGLFFCHHKRCVWLGRISTRASEEGLKDGRSLILSGQEKHPSESTPEKGLVNRADRLGLTRGSVLPAFPTSNTGKAALTGLTAVWDTGLD